MQVAIGRLELPQEHEAKSITQNYTIQRSKEDILAGANANPVHCSLLQILGRSRGFGADWTSRGEKADGP